MRVAGAHPGGDAVAGVGDDRVDAGDRSHQLGTADLVEGCRADAAVGDGGVEQCLSGPGEQQRCGVEVTEGAQPFLLAEALDLRGEVVQHNQQDVDDVVVSCGVQVSGEQGEGRVASLGGVAPDALGLDLHRLGHHPGGAAGRHAGELKCGGAEALDTGEALQGGDEPVDAGLARWAAKLLQS